MFRVLLVLAGIPVVGIALLAGYSTVSDTAHLLTRLEVHGEGPERTYRQDRSRPTPYARGGLGGNVHLPGGWHGFASPQVRNACPATGLAPRGHDDGEVGPELCLTDSGEVCLEWRLYWGPPGEAEPLPAETHAAIVAFLGRWPPSAQAERPEPALLTISAGGVAWWNSIACLLRVARDSRVAAGRIGFRVERHPHRGSLLFRVTVRDAGDEPASRAAGRILPIDLETDRVDGRTCVVVHLEGERVPLAVPEPVDGRRTRKKAARLDYVNGCWQQVEAALARVVQGRTRALFSCPPPSGMTPYEDVLTLLDLLLSHGVRHVTFPDQGLVLELERPSAPLDVLDPPLPTPRPVIPGTLAFLTVVLCAAAVASAVVPSRASPPRRPSRPAEGAD